MKVYFKDWLTVWALVLAALVIVVLATQPARAAGPWYVGPGGNDGNNCLSPAARCATINGALNKAGFVAGDTIRVAIGTYTGTGSEVVLLDKNATLSGGWDAGFTTQSGTSTIDGEDARRGITVNSGLTAVVERFTVQNGYIDSGVAVGGGILNEGTLTLNSSTISRNTARDGGGGIMSGGYGYQGTLTLNNSTVSDNVTTHWGGGIDNGYGSTLTLNSSTVSDNTALSEGGGGIFNDFGTATLNNSTVSGNTASGGGGGISSRGVLALNSSTVSGNRTTSPWNNGGGISVEDSVTLQNTIIAGNIVSRDHPDCDARFVAQGPTVITSAGYNLIGDASGCTMTAAPGDLTNIDAKLSPLEGSPGYHPLLPGSPAINAGNPAGCMGSTGLLTTDQRGFLRFGRCDIGAYEMQPIGFSTKTVNPSTVSPGDPLTYAIALSNPGATNIPNVRVTDTLPIFLTYINGSLTATSGSYGYNSGVITWTGSVNASGAVTITFGATVSQTLGFIVNTAVISGGGEMITRTATVTVNSQICNLTKHTGNPVLSVGAGGSWDDDDVWGPAVLKEGSTYKMWYSGDDGSNPSRIGLATSTNGITWTKAVANPVLSPGPSWETGGIRAGSVISDSGLYKMWYTGYDSNWVGRIGYATSPDGVTWTKYGSNPVLDVGASGSWEDDVVMRPTVIKEGGTYHLWYTGDDGMTSRIGHATSSNGTTWTKDPANSVLDIGSPGAWDWLQVYGPNAVAYNDTYLLWYSGGTLPEAWQTGYALSSDGSAWTRQKMLIPEGASGSFDADSADYSSVIVDGDEFKVWYSGLNDSGTYNIGYATAEICSEASAPPGSLVYLPIILKGGGAPPSCPAYYTDNFSNPDSGWPVDDDSNRRYAYTGGEYQIWVKQPSQEWLVTPGAKATDFAAALSARRASGSSGGYGIVFGLNEDWSEYYEFDIGSNNYSLWKYNNGSWTALRNWTASGYIKTGTNWNRLKVIRNGASISVYANNQLLTTVTDSSYTGLRRIGLLADSPSSGSLDARFDDFSLYPASCGASAAGVSFEMGEPGFHEVPMPPGLDQLP